MIRLCVIVSVRQTAQGVQTCRKPIRNSQEQLGPKALSVLGAPLATRSDLLTWIVVVRNEIAEVGRSLAVKHGFTYPEALEQTVRQSWTTCEHLLRSDGISDKA